MMIGRPREWRVFRSALGLIALISIPAIAQMKHQVASPDPEFLSWRSSKPKAAVSPFLAGAAGTKETRNFGYRPSPLNLSHIKGPVFSRSGRYARSGAGFLPSYDLRSLGQVPPVRDQGYFGTCWAFGAMGSLESSQLKASRGTFNLSEWHLAWYDYNNYNSSLVSFTKDTPGYGSDPTFDQGGSNWQSVALLARGTGAVSEAASPYQSPGYPTSALPKGTEPVIVPLQEALYLGSTYNPDDIKTALTTYGAVSIAFRWDSTYYSLAHHSFHYTGSGTNHIVDIVGWDDTFSAANFPVGNQPTSPGAWIVRNSWGPGWGENGYFYMSYETSINNPVVFVSGPSIYTQVYQYDPLGWVTELGNGNDTAWFANVFTAKSTDDIDAVSFYAGAANSEYSISIRTGVTSTPSTGVLVPASQTSGVLDAPGYRKVQLPMPVRVTAGTKFAVIVKLRTPLFGSPIPLETAVEGYSEKATAAAGQSYISDGSDLPSWYDTTLIDPKANVCLKAFAVASPVTIFANSPVTANKSGLTASAPAETGCTYTWTISGGTITSGNGTRAITYTSGPVGNLHLTCKLKNANGTELVGEREIEVVPAPMATITSLTPVTAGTSGHTASVDTQSGITSYAWTITGGTITSDDNLPELTFTAGNPGTTTLKCTVNNGAGVSITGTKTVTVSAAPNATVTAATPVTTGRTGLVASVPLQAGATYAWTIEGNGTITSATNKNTIAYSAGSPGALAIVLKCRVTNPAGTSAEIPKSIDVIATPDTTITADSPVLMNSPNLQASVPSQDGTFVWTLTGGTITSGAGTHAITYRAGGVGTAVLKCTVKNPAGTLGTGTRSVVVGTSATIVTPSPVTTGMIGLTASVPATPGATYSWSSTGISITSGEGTNRITYTAGPAGTATISCSINGTTSGTKTISVVPAPVATISAINNPITAARVGWKASVPPPQSPCTFKWTITNGTITAGATTRAIVYTAGTAGQPTTLTCAVRNAAGTTVIESLPIDVLPAPISTISADSPVVTLTSDLSASVPPQAGSFAWTITGGSILSGSTTRTILYTAGAVGTATLKCTVTNGAGTVSVGTKVVIIAAKPSANITTASPVTAGAASLTASVPAQTGCSYAWSFTGGTSAGTIDPPGNTNLITYTAGTHGAAILSCTVTGANGTSTTTSKTITVVDAPNATITAPDVVTARKAGLTASVPAPPQTCTFKWTIVGGTITAGATTRTVTYTAGSGTSLSLTCVVKNAAGTAATDTKPIKIVALPVATITAQPLVTSGVGGWTASVPFVEGSRYDWSGSTGISGISDPQADHITFTGGPVGIATLKCVVTNEAVSPTVLTGTRTLSVIAAPIADISASSSMVVGPPGSTASVPAQAGCTFQWTISAGATIETGQGTRSITFNAVTPGLITLQCIVTNTATTPATGSTNLDATARTITGQRVWHHLPFNATTGVVTTDLAHANPADPSTYIQAVLPDGTLVPGTFDIQNDTFEIPDMPGGYYWLRRGNWDYIWTDKSIVDLSVKKGGRKDVAYATNSPTTLTFNVDNLSPWSQGWDWLQLFDYNSSMWNEPDSEASSGTPGDGSTWLTGLTINWSLYQSDELHPLFDPSKGDAPRLLQMVDTKLGKIWARIAKRSFRPQITMVDGSVNYATGTFSVLPLSSSVTVNFNAADFRAANAPCNPASSSNGKTYLSFWDGPALAAHGYVGEAMQILGTDGSLVNVNTGAAAVPALPVGFQRMARGKLEHSVDLLLPGTTIPYTYTGRLRVYTRTLPTSTSPLRPMIGPVQAPKIGEVSLFQDSAAVGLTPTISWTKPSLGTAQGYAIEINEVFASGDNTSINRIANLWVGGSLTQIQLPAGILEAGKTFFIRLRAWSENGFDPRSAPYLTGSLPFGYADTLSGLITP